MLNTDCIEGITPEEEDELEKDSIDWSLKIAIEQHIEVFGVEKTKKRCKEVLNEGL